MDWQRYDRRFGALLEAVAVDPVCAPLFWPQTLDVLRRTMRGELIDRAHDWIASVCSGPDPTSDFPRMLRTLRATNAVTWAAVRVVAAIEADKALVDAGPDRTESVGRPT